MLVEDASAALSVLQAQPFEALHYPFQRQSSITRHSLQHRKTAFWEEVGCGWRQPRKAGCSKLMKWKQSAGILPYFSFFFFPLFGAFFFLQGKASSPANPFHLYSAMSQCLTRLGSLPSTLVCSTCSHAVAPKAALSSCKKCLFMFYQQKGDNSPRLCGLCRQPQR